MAEVGVCVVCSLVLVLPRHHHVGSSLVRGVSVDGRAVRDGVEQLLAHDILARVARQLQREETRVRHGQVVVVRAGGQRGGVVGELEQVLAEAQRRGRQTVAALRKSEHITATAHTM